MFDVLMLGILALARSADTTPGRSQPPGAAIRGAWKADTYVLKDGTRHAVEGHIFFTAGDWTVLFFVKDGQGRPARASGEGGTYTLDGERLIFTHRYNLSAGRALAGLPESPLRMTVAAPGDAPSEPCRVTLDGARMTIQFPSGNAMMFSRSSEP
jgi:hypothetical protein